MKINNLEQLSPLDLQGKVIAFPTDTVFGLAAMPSDSVAIEKIYQIKQRDFNKPLVILASSFNEIKPYVQINNQKINQIIAKYWPGALTIIFPKTSLVPSYVTRGLDTIAFRIPNSQVAQAILKKFGPLATTSVNLSGMPPLNDAETIYKYFGGQIDYIVTTKEKSSNFSSTIIDATKKELKIIRMGEIKIDV